LHLASCLYLSLLLALPAGGLFGWGPVIILADLCLLCLLFLLQPPTKKVFGCLWKRRSTFFHFAGFWLLLFSSTLLSDSIQVSHLSVCWFLHAAGEYAALPWWEISC
jgi:hypothetical protein